VLTLAFLAGVLALLVVVGAGSAATNGSRDAVDAVPTRVVEVAEGDTLWGIASDMAAPGETREVIHRIKELNGLSGSALVEGQRLVVPQG
jgi:hypothetical protein